MNELTDDQREGLVRELTDRLRTRLPEWTDYNEQDPGVTLIELFAFLSESILARADSIPERGISRLRDVLSRLERIPALACPAPATVARVRYFAGQQLTAADFEAEQEYVRALHRRHNLTLHQVGVVSGLDVSIAVDQPDGEPQVTVSPGYAVGPTGDELLVCEPLIANLQGASPQYLSLALVEREHAHDATGEATRVEEVVELVVAADVPTGHLAIARVHNDDGSWLVDSGFKRSVFQRS